MSFFSHNTSSSQQDGFTVIELVIGSALFTLTLVGLVAVLQGAVTLSRENERTLKGVHLLSEGMEAVRAIRDYRWSDIADAPTGTPHDISWDGDRWVLDTDPDMIDDTFLRTVTFYEVQRDSNDDIAESGTTDPGTRRVEVIVSWDGRNATTTKTVEGYLTNLFH